jgi:hypothetical protein
MQHHITVNQNSELCCTFKDEWIFPLFLISDAAGNLEF